MEELLKHEYLHNGNDIIYKELWNRLYMNPMNHNYIKPVGGLWSVRYNENFSEWMDFLFERRPEMYECAKYKNNLLFRLKELSKILIINNENDYKNLKDSGLVIKLDKPIKKLNMYNYDIIEEIPNYDKIQELYDALYVNPFADKSLRTYAVNTMLVINPDAIDYFRTINISFEENTDICYLTVNSIEEPQKIQEVSKDYFILLSILKNAFLKDFNKVKNTEELSRLIKLLEKEYTIDTSIDNLIRTGINKIDIIRSILYNIQVEHKDIIKKLIKK